MPNMMLREIGHGRRTPSRCLSAAWLILPFLIAGSAPSRAGDLAASLRAVGETIRGGALAGEVGLGDPYRQSVRPEV